MSLQGRLASFGIKSSILASLLALCACTSLSHRDPDGVRSRLLGKPPAVQRQLLAALNDARRPQDLIGLAPDELNLEDAERILRIRDSIDSRSFTAIVDLFPIDPRILDTIDFIFSPAVRGRWALLPYNVQRPDGSLFSTAHASVLNTGHVIFFPNFDTNQTVIWDPADERVPQFRFPTVHSSEFLFCSSHVFLPDGRLLAVGGGGNSSTNAIDSAWLFDPADDGWSKSPATMRFQRWYPTTVAMGDGRVFVTAGLGGGGDRAEIFDPSAISVTDVFTDVDGPPSNPTGAQRSFPETYPSLHLVPRGEIIYTRTGWGHSVNDSTITSASFKFTGTGTNEGEWTEMTWTSMNSPDRTEGMAVLLFQDHNFSPSIVVVGGGNPSTTARGSSEIIDFGGDFPSWRGHPQFLPDERFNVNAVLLPDGQVLAVGGQRTLDSPALLFHPTSNTWRSVAPIAYPRTYHSVAVLLPNGKVAVTGGDYGNTLDQRTTIEIYEPPYLFGDAQPIINSWDEVINYQADFRIVSDGTDIDQIVLMRPMSVTHHTDSEQRRLELQFTRTGVNITATAPRNSNVAPPGYYMLFLLNDGVPSEARFVRLQAP